MGISKWYTANKIQYQKQNKTQHLFIIAFLFQLFIQGAQGCVHGNPPSYLIFTTTL